MRHEHSHFAAERSSQVYPVPLGNLPITSEPEAVTPFAVRLPQPAPEKTRWPARQNNLR
jgi:hypothetical protein